MKAKRRKKSKLFFREKRKKFSVEVDVHQRKDFHIHTCIKVRRELQNPKKNSPLYAYFLNDGFFSSKFIVEIIPFLLVVLFHLIL